MSIHILDIFPKLRRSRAHPRAKKHPVSCETRCLLSLWTTVIPGRFVCLVRIPKLHSHISPGLRALKDAADLIHTLGKTLVISV